MYHYWYNKDKKELPREKGINEKQKASDLASNRETNCALPANSGIVAAARS